MPRSANTPAASTPPDWPVRIVGLLVFLAGVGLLAWVFVMANRLFHAPAPPLPAVPPPNTANPGPSPFLAIGAGFSDLLQRLLLLLLMSVAGSVIASKGVQLYFAARPLTLPADTPPPAGPTVAPAAKPPAPTPPKSGTA